MNLKQLLIALIFYSNAISVVVAKGGRKVAPIVVKQPTLAQELSAAKNWLEKFLKNNFKWVVAIPTAVFIGLIGTLWYRQCSGLPIKPEIKNSYAPLPETLTGGGSTERPLVLLGSEIPKKKPLANSTHPIPAEPLSEERPTTSAGIDRNRTLVGLAEACYLSESRSARVLDANLSLPIVDPVMAKFCINMESSNRYNWCWINTAIHAVVPKFILDRPTDDVWQILESARMGSPLLGRAIRLQELLIRTITNDEFLNQIIKPEYTPPTPRDQTEFIPPSDPEELRTMARAILQAFESAEIEGDYFSLYMRVLCARLRHGVYSGQPNPLAEILINGAVLTSSEAKFIEGLIKSYSPPIQITGSQDKNNWREFFDPIHFQAFRELKSGALPSVSINYVIDHGHWFSIILYKKADNTIAHIFLDSLDKGDGYFSEKRAVISCIYKLLNEIPNSPMIDLQKASADQLDAIFALFLNDQPPSEAPDTRGDEAFARSLVGN